MKKIINDPKHIVSDMCSGIIFADNRLSLNSKYKLILKKRMDKSKVTLISGGGSGHEPAHAGFIGKGLLDAAVCGDVFASPTQIQVYQAIRGTAGDKGTLLIIKNYSGDMMNFKNALHMAQEDGLSVDYVKVDDDVAVNDSLYTVGRRGVAGTVFVHKIVGAAAEQGLSLPEVKRVAEKVISNVKSIGIALTSCTVPAKGSPTFELGEMEMEYGVGIHGEPGIRREKIVSARELAGRMLVSLCDELKFEADKGTRAAILINGFGATPLMELYVLNKEVIRELYEKGVTVTRSFVGNFMTSIDMAGASVSILRLDDELEAFLNAPCESLALNISGAEDDIEYRDFFTEGQKDAEYCFTVETPDSFGIIGDELTLENMIYIVDVMSDSIIKNEVLFCEMDSYAGDGDFGMSVAKGFRQLKREWKTIIAQSKNIGSFLDACSLVLMEHCGGASGPIWGSAFRSAGKFAGERTSLKVADFAALLQSAVMGIQSTGKRSFGRGAVVGDKTLIDALAPCADAWRICAANAEGFTQAFRAGASAATEGAEKTKNIVARMGRAGAVGERSLGYPDAGAYGLGVVFTDITDALQTSIS